MKKYMFFIGTLRNGGAERVVSILSGRMAEQGMEVEILTYYDRPVFYEIHPKVKVTAVETASGKKNKVSNFLWLRKYLKENAKIVISFLAPFNIMAIAAVIGTGIPVIAADRNDPTKIPSNTMIRKLRDVMYRFADGVVVQTEKNKAYFGKAVQKKSKVIYNPVNLGEYAAAALDCDKEKTVVSVGRLMPQKNQKMLIEAFASVLKKYPEYQLIIYGDGQGREELEKLISERKLESRVLLPGSTTQLHEKIKSAELFVLSSDYEGMPNALIEAMCLGLPVISTKVSGATDLIKDHENGLLTEVGNQSELEAAMLELLENKELSAKLSKKAVELNEMLELSQIMEQWIAFIKEIL